MSNVSVPTLDPVVWRTTEPGTAPPRQRLRAVRMLIEAGIDAHVGMAPLLPGLSDSPAQLELTAMCDVQEAVRDWFRRIPSVVVSTADYHEMLRSDQVALNHIDLNRTLASDPPDLAVWPENALDFDPAFDGGAGAAVASAIRRVGVPTIVGAITDAPNDRYYNQKPLETPFLAKCVA